MSSHTSLRLPWQPGSEKRIIFPGLMFNLPWVFNAGLQPSGGQAQAGFSNGDLSLQSRGSCPGTFLSPGVPWGGRADSFVPSGSEAGPSWGVATSPPKRRLPPRREVGLLPAGQSGPSAEGTPLASATCFFIISRGERETWGGLTGRESQEGLGPAFSCLRWSFSSSLR